MAQITIKQNKAYILKALYDKAEPDALALRDYEPGDMSLEEAQQLLKKIQYFDVLKGRSLKIDLSGDEEFDSFLYDKYNGYGAAQEAIRTIKNN